MNKIKPVGLPINKYLIGGSAREYVVKKGDTLSSIAQKTTGSTNNYQQISDLNNIKDVNKLAIGTVLKLPTAKLPKSSSSYTIKAGDNLTSIAKANNQDLNLLIALNNISDPNKLSVGQTLKLSNNSYVPKSRSIQEISKIEEELNSKSNLDIINSYHGKYQTNKPYIIDDKASGYISVYNNGKLVKQYKAIHGKDRSSDAMTTTKIDSKGNLINLAGNLSTPAGLYFTTRGNKYHGAPSFIRRTQKMVDENNPNGIPSSIHARTVTESANTNGCTGVECRDLQDMDKILGKESNIPTYILPVNDQNKFFVRNGQLQFKSADPSKTPSHNTVISKPIDRITYKTRGLDNNQREVINKFSKSLINNKAQLQSKLNINDDTYNKLSQMALGILGTESTYGKRNSGIGNLARYITKGLSSVFGIGTTASPDIYSKYHTYGVDGDSNSVGLTQMRWSQLSEDTRKLLQEYNITKDDLVNSPEKTAIATLAKLADEYKRRGNNLDKALSSWNSRSVYPSLVSKNSNTFQIQTTYKGGGKL